MTHARTRGLEVEARERSGAGRLDEAAHLLGLYPRQIRGDSFVFALVPGDRQISWPKLRAVVGVNKLSMPLPDVA